MTTSAQTTMLYVCNIMLGDSLIVVPQKTNDFTKYLHELDITSAIDVNGTTELHINLENNGMHDFMYIKILDNASRAFNFDMLMNALTCGLDYFNTFHITFGIKDRIMRWVKSLGNYSYTWTELLEKPNYDLELFTKRFWPYFNAGNKDWKHIATSARYSKDKSKTTGPGKEEGKVRYEYPSDKDNVVNDILKMLDDNTLSSNEIAKEYQMEYNISQKFNNFLGYSVLDPSKYPNLDKIINHLKSLEKLNMRPVLFEAILRLMITPSACHIIKIPEFWDMAQSFIAEHDMYKDLVYYYMYYAMFILGHEDTVMFSQIKRNYRIIFAHHEAVSLPKTYMMHIERDPYIQRLSGETYLTNSVPYYLRCKRYIQPIDVFERRLYLATGGALANINLAACNAAVSGSILVPCNSYSELEDDFARVRFNTMRNIPHAIKFNDDLYTPVGKEKLTEKEKDFMSYLEYYYPSYHSLTATDYVSQVLVKLPVDDKQHSAIDEEKNDLNNKKGKIKYNSITDIDISVTADNYDTFSKVALIIAGQIRRNCAHIGEVWIHKVITVSSFKYKLYGPGLIRPIDLFRVPYGPDRMVKKFHCPVVRSWYDGASITNQDTANKYLCEFRGYWNHAVLDKTNAAYTTTTGKYNNTTKDGFELISTDVVYSDDETEDNSINAESETSSNNVEDDAKNDIESKSDETNHHYRGLNILYSSVCALNSGVNGGYKWFFNSKPCVEVILKIAQRGYTTIINNKEMDAIISYMKNSPRWKDFVADDIDIRGTMSKDHLFFTPDKTATGIRYKLRRFNKPGIETYSKKLYVGLVKAKSVYGADLTIKDNKKVYMPDTNKINMFIEYMGQTQQDEFSDGDDL